MRQQKISSIVVVLGTILASILLMAVLVFTLTEQALADESYFSDTYNQIQGSEAWSPNNRRTSDYETDQRRYNQYRDQQIQRQNQETIDGYYRRSQQQQQPTYQPNGSERYSSEMYGLIDRYGNPHVCQRAANVVYCQ